MSYFLFSPSGFLRRYQWHILSSKLSMSFLLQGFSHMSLQWGNTLYAVSLSPYFSTGFEGVFNSISIKYFSSFLSYRTFWMINTIHWSQDGFDQRWSVTTAKELISSGNIWERSHDGTVDAPLSLSHYRSNRRRHGRLPACSLHGVHTTCIYMYITDQWRLLVHFAIHRIPFTFQFSQYIRLYTAWHGGARRGCPNLENYRDM
jgi:hypothetical protein